jgi:CubicO group peptidase (beta-lactamase class C family)
MRALLAVVLVAGVAFGPAGASARDVASIDEVYARWIKQHGVTRAALAVARGDRLVLAKGYGGLAPDRRVLLGSLSKAITATCTVALIQQGKLRFDAPLGELLDRVGRRYGAPRDARLRAVTVEQLLTHRAGFARSQGDPATGRTLVELLARRPVSQVTMHDLVPGVLRTPLEHEPGTRHAYTNAPHLLLGLWIEAITGQPYESSCAETVLRPHGIVGGKLHEKWGVLGSFGGWGLSGPEYLAFFRAFAPSGTFFTPETRKWLVTGEGKEVDDGPVFYTLLRVRPVSSGGHNFFHTGSWNYRQAPTGPSGGIDDSIGTFAVRWVLGVSLFAYFEPRPDSAARSALDHELSRAVAAVRTWPEIDLYPALGMR